MKRLIQHFLTILIVFFFYSNNLKSQPAGILHANLQLRSLFGNLTLPPNPKLFLYDMSCHVTDSVFFTTKCPDTLDIETWYKIYQEMYYSAYDTTKHIDPDVLYQNGHSYYSDTIPFGIMNYAFYKLKPKTLTTNIYFDFDIPNNKLIDKFPRPNPYIDSNIFAASPLVKESYFSNPVFRIDPDFILHDLHNNIKYNNEHQLVIDFGDGNGWQKFDASKITHHTVNYGSEGIKYIRAGIKNNNSNKLIHYSISKLSIRTSRQVVKPNSIINTPGLNVGVYSGCNTTGITSGKVVIYLPGIDMLDILPGLNRDIPRIYDEMISNNKIVQLKNQGYSFLVVDYKKSTIDMRFNALYIINLLEKLKCNLDMEHQFVIMGESMGGLIGRYAMTYMESRFYDNRNISPFFVDAGDPNNSPYLNAHPDIFNLPQQWCLTAKRHNTRLLLTLDTPHQGANIPLSIQHAYKSLVKFISNISGFQLKTYTNALNLFIDSQAAQQMLIYHVDTKVGSNYDSHSDKYSFFNQLKNLGDYPKFAKVTALSNGSISGELQTNYYTYQDRTPGDRLIDLEGDFFFRILGRKFPLVEAQLDCRTNPNNYGHIYSATAKVFSVSLQVYWFGIRFNVGLKTIINDVAYANVLPYGVNAGGFTGDPLFISATPSIQQHNMSNTWILNLVHATSKYTGSGCMIFDAHAGWNGFFSGNVDFSMCSDGLHFTIVPVQSALDYGTLGNDPLNHNIEYENIKTKLAKVKPDAIIGYPGIGIYQNRNHLGSYVEPFRNINIYNITQQKAPNNDFTYYTCINYNDNVQRGLINLEVGDEELYLENAELDWTSLYQAEFDIHVNERNPIYEYPNGFRNFSIDGAYSKDNPYIINSNASATFIVDELNSPTNLGLTYAIPYSGTYYKINDPLQICCIDFIGSRLKNNRKEEFNSEIYTKLELFPNPNNGKQLVIKYQFKYSGDVTLELYNSIGIKVLTKSLESNSPALETTEVISINSHLKNGIYIVRLRNGIEFLTKRLIISQ